MVRRAALLLVLGAIAVAPAGADTIEDRKQSVDAQIAALGQRVASTQRREERLRAQVDAASSEIRVLAQRVTDISNDLVPLERELELRRERLRQLNELFRLQTERLKLLRRQHQIALRRLGDRLASLYRQEETDTLSLLLSSTSFTDALDVFDYLRRIAEQDRRIADEVGSAKERVRAQRAQTKTTRNRHRQETRVVALRVTQVRTLRDRLAASRSGLVAKQVERQQDLAQLTAAEREQLAEMEALQEVSATLAAKIQAAQAASGTGGGSPSAQGLIWPVLGPVTSAFGWRWGRMHEGIDIGVPSGTPIRAAASGTVIHAGWLGGYGNLVVLDHGGGLSTAYAHQSSIASGYGQFVTQGQVIGYVGSTGHSTGPHLHFEVRVNGVPQDPLGYLS
ncbi:MAG TPA: peptidoglycan DD-metalloendopeptidase family protein [Gaiellaceae bacterium]|nr:peptidoglycan DD-metalloendopeptidase family protein [Gaiellaceae bacterium]